MLDQLIIGDKASLDDFDASLATRSIGVPKMKTIKETVPFSNVTYDFTRINGEPYYEERKLEYGFEIVAEDPEELEDKKAAFAEWVMSVFEADIHDPHIFDFHFRGTYEDLKFKDDDSLEKTTASVTFTAYPYKIANVPKVYEEEIQNSTASSRTRRIWVTNNSSHPVPFRIEVYGDTTTVTYPDGSISTWMASSTLGNGNGQKLSHEHRSLFVIEAAASSTPTTSVRISFYEEVL